MSKPFFLVPLVEKQAFKSMQQIIFEEALEALEDKDQRYHHDAYLFVREALACTHAAVAQASGDSRTYVTGDELLSGIRELALAEFGPMTTMVFREWGIYSCRDFGEIVSNLMKMGLLASSGKDFRIEFENGFDFDETFRKPFLPKFGARIKDIT